jgi:cyclohexanecarboxylate-CoA ligase
MRGTMPVLATRARYPLEPELAAQESTSTALLIEIATLHPEYPCIIDGENVLTYDEVLRGIRFYQIVLMDNGILPGDVVSVQLPNWWETVVIAHAIWSVGAVLNPITPIYRGSELRTLFGLARPKVVIVPETFRDLDYSEMVDQALTEASVPAKVVTFNHSDDFRRDGISKDHVKSGDIVDLSTPDDICLLMFTSGTTGTPKGVLHNHRTLQYECRSIIDLFDLKRECVFMPSPLAHITGLLYGVIMPILMRSEVVLQSRWDPKEARRLIEGNQCKVTVAATPFLRGLLDEYQELSSRSSLEVFICGGADIPPQLIAEASDVLGTKVVRAYGLTEMPTVTCGGPTDPREISRDTDGRPTGTSRVRLSGSQEGTGELEVTGPELFLGYLDEADNISAFAEDGWFKTGDLATIGENGAVTIVGRSKDLIVRGGENISTKEVEDLLLTLPEIQDVAIVGIPDELLGERACAAVVSTDKSLNIQQISQFLSDKSIAKYKFPEHLLFVENLPRTASGKVQKFVLRKECAVRLSRGEGESR